MVSRNLFWIFVWMLILPLLLFAGSISDPLLGRNLKGLFNFFFFRLKFGPNFFFFLSIEKTEKDTNKAKPLIEFEPAILEFNEKPVCLPAVETIRIYNNLHTEEVVINSIATDSVEVNPGSSKHSIPPGTYVNLTIIFLARTYGSVSRRMIFQTNLGNFVYEVRHTFFLFFAQRPIFVE